MAEKEVVITYETLFEFLRLEKNRAQLQKLDQSFFSDVLKYIDEKLAILQDDAPQTSLFASAEKEKTRRELENIGRILRELYDRREKKIIETALIKARTNEKLVDTATMLPLEKELYDTLTNDLKLYRSAGILKLLNGEEPKSASQQSNETAGPSQEPSPVAEEANIYKEEAAPSKPDGTMSVRFISAVDEIVGPDLQIYGPFEPQAMADLPQELANALINNQQAERT
ncbi:MAG: hypothetical protein ACE5DM_01295 [Candidatus Nanoarchaeia archaeon]